MTDYLQLAREVVWQAAAYGGEAEAYLNHQTETNIRVDRGEVEQLSQSTSMGLGVRVIKAGRVGYAYTSDFSPEGIAATVRAAAELAEIATPDANRQLPDPQPIADVDLQIYDPKLSDVPAAAKVEFIKKVERAALDHDSRIIGTIMCTYMDAVGHTYLANSRGFAGSYSQSFAGAYLMGVAQGEQGMMNAMNVGFATSFDQLNPVEIGTGAAQRALQLLDGVSVETQTCTVVFDPIAAAEIIGYLSLALTADAMQRGRSFLIDKLGQDVASDKVTLLDNGRLPGGLASAPFDAEGVPTGATRLIDEGVFQAVIYDSYTARRDGVKATGNATRSSHRELPALRPTNFYLQPGVVSRDELIAGVERGLYVTSIMQTGGINPITGDCSMGANGLWIENGVLTHAVNGVTVATTLPDLLKNISEVASDLRIVPFMGAIGAPTIRVDNVTVGGTG